MYEAAPVRRDVIQSYDPGNRTGVIPPTRLIVLHDQEMEIHNTNNFYFKFHIYQKWQKELPPENLFEEVYPPHFREARFPILFQRLEQSRPALYAKLMEIHETQLSEERIRNKVRREQELTPEEKDLHFRSILRPIQEEPESLLFYSKAFDSLAKFAKEIDPAYDTGIFCL